MGIFDFSSEKQNKSPTDAWADVAAAYERKLALRLEQLRSEKPSELRDLEMRKAERIRIVEALKLGDKLIAVWDHIQHFPSWAKNGNETHVMPLVRNPVYLESGKDKARKDRDQPERSMGFELNGTSYRMGFGQSFFTAPDGDSCWYGDFFFGDSERWLLVVNTSGNYKHEHISWKPFGIAGFIPGDWIKDYLQLYEEVIVDAQRNREKFLAGDPEKIKRNFDL